MLVHCQESGTCTAINVVCQHAAVKSDHSLEHYSALNLELTVGYRFSSTLNVGVLHNGDAKTNR